VPRPFTLNILTRERETLSEPIISLVAPGADGYLGVRAGHAPLITELVVGKLRVSYQDGSQDVVPVSGGFLEVRPEETTILAETAERADEIDIERAKEAAERARRRLAEKGTGEQDVARARRALMRALNRLNAVK